MAEHHIKAKLIIFKMISTDIFVEAPGCIKDHLQSGQLDLSKLHHVVLDEVDTC